MSWLNWDAPLKVECNVVTDEVIHSKGWLNVLAFSNVDSSEVTEDVLVGHLNRKSSLCSNAVHCGLDVNLVNKKLTEVFTDFEIAHLFSCFKLSNGDVQGTERPCNGKV